MNARIWHLWSIIFILVGYSQSPLLAMEYDFDKTVVPQFDVKQFEIIKESIAHFNNQAQFLHLLVEYPLEAHFWEAVQRLNMHIQSDRQNELGLYAAIRYNHQEQAFILLKDYEERWAKDRNNNEYEKIISCALDLANMYKREEAFISILQIFNRFNVLVPSSYLYDYVMEDNYRLAALLLPLTEDINYLEADSGCNSLHMAVRTESLDMVKMLCAHKDIDVDTSDRDGHTALEYASHIQDPSILAYLLKLTKKSTYDQQTRTLLHIALGRKCSLAIIKTICENAPTLLMERDINGDRPLHYASMYASEEIIAYLLSLLDVNSNITNTAGETALMVAIDEDKVPAFELLFLDKNIDLKKHNFFVLINFILKHGITNTAIITKLLENFDVNQVLTDTSTTQPTALHLAIYSNNNAMLNALLQCPEIDVNKSLIDGQTPLNFAVLRGSIVSIQRLLQHPNIDVNAPRQDGTTPLGQACALGSKKIVELLLKHPEIDPNEFSVFNNQLCVPLTIAVYNHDLELVKMLVAHKKININAIDADSLSVIDNVIIRAQEIYASGDENRDIVINYYNSIIRYLMRFGAVPYLYTDTDQDETLYQYTLLILENAFDKEFLSALLANYNKITEDDVRKCSVGDEDGATLLMYLTSQGEVEAVKKLLQYGINPLVQDNAGNTALSIVQTMLARFSVNNNSKEEVDEDSEALRERYKAIENMLYEATINAMLFSESKEDEGSKETGSSPISPLKRQLDGKEEEEPTAKKTVITSFFDTLPTELLFEIVKLA